MTARIEIAGAGLCEPVRLEERRGTPLAQVLRRAAPAFLLVCGGAGTCGKCLIWARGALSAPTAREAALLARAGGQPPVGYAARLACFCTVAGDVDILLPVGADTVGGAAPGGFALPAYDGHATGATGIACDVGTTTITLTLYGLNEGRALATVHQMNRQGAFGADVISRIAYSNAHGVGELRDALRGQLADMMAEAASRSGRPLAGVERAVVTGNTTMLHYLMGLDPAGIGVAPFTPASLFGTESRAAEIFGGLPETATLYLPPCVGAYVGADVTCGLLACGFAGGDGTRLLVDVGTNGEMALLHDGRLLCCATAAGPAFEGAQITMGMPAVPGAICRVTQADGQLCAETIGETEARGICGTGLVSAVNTLLAAGVIDGGGRFLPEGHPFADLVTSHGNAPAVRLTGDVVLTQGDVRAIQLAKAAIAAGIDTLLAQAEVPPEAVAQTMLAGGFGSAIDPAEAAGIGLIPHCLAAGTGAVGNAALAGAAILLFSQKARATALELARGARELSLSADPRFMDAYMENMLFYEE